MSSSTWRVLSGYATDQRTPMRMTSWGKWAPLKLIAIVLLPHDVSLVIEGDHTANSLKGKLATKPRLPPSDPIMAYRQFRFEPGPFEGVQQEPVDVWHSCCDWTQSWASCQRFWLPTNRQTCAMLRLQRRS